MIKRYGWANGMEQLDDGTWVKFEDHEKALVPLTAEIRCLRASNKALDEEYEARRLERDTAIADKRELVEALESLSNLVQSRGIGVEPANSWKPYLNALALIAKHKEGV